jgi:uncharacterized iron-regulated membrane protein
MAPMLYVYYKLPAERVPAVAAEVRRVQAALCRAHPGLQADLLRRPEAPDGVVTLMETYAGALTPAVEAAIAEATSALPGPRHSERFIPLEPAP